MHSTTILSICFSLYQPYAHCSYYTALLMKPSAFEYDNKELLAATEKATLPELVSYVGSVWSSGKGIALVQGNLDEKQAQALVSTIDKTLGFKPIPVEECPPELTPIPLPESPANSMGTRLVISGKSTVNLETYYYGVSRDETSTEKRDLQHIHALKTEAAKNYSTRVLYLNYLI